MSKQHNINNINNAYLNISVSCLRPASVIVNCSNIPVAFPTLFRHMSLVSDCVDTSRYCGKSSCAWMGALDDTAPRVKPGNTKSKESSQMSHIERFLALDSQGSMFIQNHWILTPSLPLFTFVYFQCDHPPMVVAALGLGQFIPTENRELTVRQMRIFIPEPCR